MTAPSAGKLSTAAHEHGDGEEVRVRAEEQAGERVPEIVHTDSIWEKYLTS